MAKYTELLSEYIEEGGELPTLFDTIEGFSDLFLGEYADREIGFETPALFALKLNYTAALVIPPYSKRLAAISVADELILNPNKKHVKTGNLTRSRNGEIVHTDGASVVTTTNDNGRGSPEVTSVFEQPYANTDGAPALAQPITVTQTDKPVTETKQVSEETTSKESYNNYVETETYNDVTDSEEGFTSSEALAVAQHFEEERALIMRELLGEFDSLFMGIY